jgi:hypothetical protein
MAVIGATARNLPRVSAWDFTGGVIGKMTYFPYKKVKKYHF